MWVMRMIKAIAELKKTHKEMTEVLSELEVLEDGVACDYSSVTIDYKWLVNELNHRLTTLKNRKGGTE